VVTGMGAVTPFGVGLPALWDGITAGRSGVRTLSRFDSSPFRTKIAGECLDFDTACCEYADAERIDRVGQLALAAAAEAMRGSGIEVKDGDDFGVLLGTGLGGIGTIDAQSKLLYEKEPRAVHPLAVPNSMANAAAGHLSIRYGLRGPSFTVATACASSANAIGEAFG
jgi:3-oxoacyl-[acyl-carrier-protein] synthase II